MPSKAHLLALGAPPVRLFPRAPGLHFGHVSPAKRLPHPLLKLVVALAQRLNLLHEELALLDQAVSLRRNVIGPELRLLQGLAPTAR
jgi:hypothetical protein